MHAKRTLRDIMCRCWMAGSKLAGSHVMQPAVCMHTAEACMHPKQHTQNPACYSQLLYGIFLYPLSDAHLCGPLTFAFFGSAHAQLRCMWCRRSACLTRVPPS